MTGQHESRAGDADVQEILAVLRDTPARARGGHSPIYLWLWRHHGQLQEELDPPCRPDWPALAAELGKRGVVDGAGKPPTAERTRKAWWQVSRDKAAVAAGTVRRRGKASAAVAGQPASQARPSSSAPDLPLPFFEPVEAVEVEPERKYTFQFASAKDWTKVADKGDG